MLQQLTIKTSNKATLKPVLRSAMEGEKRMIALRAAEDSANVWLILSSSSACPRRNLSAG